MVPRWRSAWLNQLRREALYAGPDLLEMENCHQQSVVIFEQDFYSASAQLAMQSAVLAIVNPSVRLSVRPSVHLSVTRWHCVKTTQATIMGSSL